MMKRIFCLETEWIQSVQDLKSKPTVTALLDFMESALGIPYIFRQVATVKDFCYYIGHLDQASYDAYDTVYLCFHGSSGRLHFADGSDYPLDEFARVYANIFENRTVLFDCCSTLRLDDEYVNEFKKRTGARMIIGYGKKVDFIKSFVFEMWLLNALATHPDYGARRLFDLAQKEMPEHVKSLRFKAY